MSCYCLDSETHAALIQLVAIGRDFLGGEPVLEGLTEAERAWLAQAARDAWLLLNGSDAPADFSLPDYLRALGRFTNEALDRYVAGRQTQPGE
ncbi:MAG: hypothetical protein PHE83_17315 [Opitutaceae bacterium]|nr:hypothetical protein [Opitutaceae bacterium]